MQFTKLEHIGIAVKDLNISSSLFENISGHPSYKTEIVESEGVKTAFFKVDSVKIELLQAINESSPIAKFISNRGEGMHHMAFEVEDIEASMDKMRQDGIRLLNETPKKGADNKLICFLHPKDTNGVLIELCQEITADRIE